MLLASAAQRLGRYWKEGACVANAPVKDGRDSDEEQQQTGPGVVSSVGPASAMFQIALGGRHRELEQFIPRLAVQPGVEGRLAGLTGQPAFRQNKNLSLTPQAFIGIKRGPRVNDNLEQFRECIGKTPAAVVSEDVGMLVKKHRDRTGEILGEKLLAEKPLLGAVIPALAQFTEKRLGLGNGVGSLDALEATPSPCAGRPLPPPDCAPARASSATRGCWPRPLRIPLRVAAVHRTFRPRVAVAVQRDDDDSRCGARALGIRRELREADA